MRTRQMGAVKEEHHGGLQMSLRTRTRRDTKVDHEAPDIEREATVNQEPHYREGGVIHEQRGRASRGIRGEHNPHLPFPHIIKEDEAAIDEDSRDVSRRGTPDSAISSRWSVSSRASTAVAPGSRSSSPAHSTNSQHYTTSHHIRQNYNLPSSHTNTMQNTHATYSNGVGCHGTHKPQHLPSSQYMRSATPQVRSNGTGRGKLLTARHPGSGDECIIGDSSGGGGWVVVLLYIAATWAASLITQHSQMDGGGSKPVSVAVCVCGWLMFGLLSDLTPSLALTLPPLLPLLHFALASYSLFLPYIHLGLLGCQILAVHTNNNNQSVAGQAEVLAWLGLAYGVAAFTVPALITLTIHHLGYSHSLVVVTIVCILSVIAAVGNLYRHSNNVFSLMKSEGVNEGRVRRLLCWSVMKMCVTVPTALLLPHLQELVERCGSSGDIDLSRVVTLGLLVTPVVVMPLLLLCTSLYNALTASTLTLTALYTTMVWTGVSGWGGVGTVLVVPVCGVSAVVQTLLLVYLLAHTHTRPLPLYTPGPGTLLAINLSLHSLARLLTASHLAVWVRTSPWPSHILGLLSYSSDAATAAAAATASTSVATVALSGSVCSVLLCVTSRIRIGL